MYKILLIFAALILFFIFGYEGIFTQKPEYSTLKVNICKNIENSNPSEIEKLMIMIRMTSIVKTLTVLKQQDSEFETLVFIYNNIVKEIERNTDKITFIESDTLNLQKDTDNQKPIKIQSN